MSETAGGVVLARRFEPAVSLIQPFFEIATVGIAIANPEHGHPEIALI
jgi:hypothetical protein